MNLKLYDQLVQNINHFYHKSLYACITKYLSDKEETMMHGLEMGKTVVLQSMPFNNIKQSDTEELPVLNDVSKNSL